MNDEPGTFRWTWTEFGCYSASTAYRAFFFGLTEMPGANEVWNSWAQPQLKFFAWLVVKNRCWTSDHLAARGLPHQLSCLMCLQEPETLDHLLVQCSLARTVWFEALRVKGWESFTPSQQDVVVDWWTTTSNMVAVARKELNSYIILVLNSIWKERNKSVFDKISLATSGITAHIADEWKVW